MQQVGIVPGKLIHQVAAAVVGAAMAVTLSVAPLAVPASAEAASLEAAAMTAPAQLSTQASVAAVAAADAKAVVKKAKATKGTAEAKLKKVYAYIAKDKSFKGVYQIESLPFFKVKYGDKFYSYLPREVVEKSLLKKNYKKYAVDMFNDKKGTCFHYAALFGIAAKQVLGNSATVKIAAGASQHTGEKVDYHSWVEVTMDGKTYVYDTQAGNSLSKSNGKATAFGDFCGAEKSKLKANYYNYKGVQYTTVKL